MEVRFEGQGPAIRRQGRVDLTHRDQEVGGVVGDLRVARRQTHSLVKRDPRCGSVAAALFDEGGKMQDRRMAAGQPLDGLQIGARCVELPGLVGAFGAREEAVHVHRLHGAKLASVPGHVQPWRQG